MRAVTIPVWQALASLPPVLALEGAVQADSRVALIALWSWVAEHGAGPHAPTTVERAVGWTGTPGLLASALVATDWATENDDGRVTVRPWVDVVGAADAESPAERRRRLTRERVRKHREYERNGVTPRNAPVTLGNASVTLRNAPVTLGNADVTLDRVTGNADVTLGNASPATDRDLSLFSYSLQKKNQNQNRKEQVPVGLIAAPAAPDGLAAVLDMFAGHAASDEIARRLTLDPGADITDLVFDDVVEPMAQERPAVAPGSTISPEVRSVPVTTPDLAPEGDDGPRRPKRSKSKKAAVLDLDAVDPAVREVWDAYAATVGTRVVLSAARVELIAARLADGWTVDDLSTACHGYGLSPFHNGENDRKQLYKTIELWLRDAAHVEQGLAFAKNPPAKKGAPRAVESIEEKWRILAEKYGDETGEIHEPGW